MSWGACALILAVFILLVRLAAPNFFLSVFTPVFGISEAFTEKSHAFFSSFGDTAALALQNEKLAEENRILILQNLALQDKTNTLSRLTADGGGIRAGVVARPPQSPYDTLVLAGGSDDGIELGMEAFSAGNVPLGVVTSVLPAFTRVTLFSSPSLNTAGWVGEKKLPITIVGAGAGTMQASVARSAGIVAGDVVFVPGPGMLAIGTVVRADSDRASPSVTLRIVPAANLFSTAWVSLRDTGLGAVSSTTPFSP